MFLSKLSLVLCIFAFGQINAQSYNFPKLNLTVSWTVNKNTTKFTLVHNKTDFSNRWIAVGINTKEEMVLLKILKKILSHLKILF